MLLLECRKPEVENFCVSAQCYKDVCWLDVPMDYAFRVRRVHALGDLNRKVEQFIELERMPKEVLVERFAFQQLHRNEVLAVSFTNLMDSTNIRMVQRRGSACFPIESLERSRFPCEIIRKKFQSDIAAQNYVFGPIDNTHTAGADLLQNPVVRNYFHNHSRLLDYPSVRSGPRFMFTDWTVEPIQKVTCAFNWMTRGEASPPRKAP